MTSADLAFTPATELARLIRAKKLSPVELTRAVLDRVERLNPIVNAFCTVTADLALAAAREAEQALMKGEARGPLHGIPFSIKDLHYTKNVRTMSGSVIFAERVPDVDPPVIRRLKQAGGVMLGKTTTPEFGWKGLGDSPLTGITRNPWNTGMTTGGSSAGPGAATAAEVATLVAQAVGAFGELGCVVEEVKPGFADSHDLIRCLWSTHEAGNHAQHLSQWRDRMDPGLVACIEEGMRYSMVDYVEARAKKLAYWDTVRPLFEKYDLLLTPTLSVAAFPVGRLNPEHWSQHVWDWIRWASFSYPFNFTGQPAASVPAGFTPAGLPVGLQIVGRRFADLTVLQASAAFEAARPWAQRRPALD